LRALRRIMAFPSIVFGPVECRAFAWFAAFCRSLVTFPAFAASGTTDMYASHKPIQGTVTLYQI